MPGTGAATALSFALPEDVQTADAVWGQSRRATDTHGWEWERVLAETDDCVYQLSSPAYPLAALIGLHRRELKLSAGRFRRLNYFQIAPDLRAMGVGRLALAIAGRMVLDAGAEGLVICALPAPKLIEWYVAAGGAREAPPGWQAPKTLVPICFDAAKLATLAGYADAFQEEQAEP